MAKLDAGLRNRLLHSRRGLSSLGYVGMGATDARFGSWVPTSTLENDGLASLSAFYGVSPRDICAANGVPFQSDPINQWVVSKGGRCQAYQAGQPKVAGCPDGGWAAFRAGNQILLPNIPRPGTSSVTAKPPTPGGKLTPPVAAGTKKKLNWALIGTVGLVGIAVVASIMQSKKPAAKPAAKSSVGGYSTAAA